MFIDSHCHIEDTSLISRAKQAGVTGILNAGKDIDEMDLQLKICHQFENIWTSVGIHPDSAPNKLHISVEDIINKSKDKKVIAIGECGLDYHYGAEYKEQQLEVFKKHIIAAGITNIPLMIHQRLAEEDILSCLYDGLKKYDSLKGVIHCFTSNLDFANEINKLGFYISASGIITFKSGQDICNVFKDYPTDKFLIETDSPYLTPVPYRGKTNEPLYVIETAKKLAEIKGLTIEKIASITTNNFFNLYPKAKYK